MDTQPTSPVLPNNPFAEAFAKVDEAVFFEQLEAQVSPKSYYQQYRGLKNTIVVFSYLLNLVSALTASYLIYWLTQWLFGIPWLGYVLAGLFLFFLERLKRLSSNEFFQVYFFRKQLAMGWLGFSLFLFGLSVAGTYFGTQQSTIDLAPDAPIVHQDSLLNRWYTDLAAIENQIENARETRWKGTTTRESQKTITTLTEEKSELRTQINGREAEIGTKNTGTEVKHEQQVQLTAATLAWIAVLLEILFEACIAYIWFYYYRSYVEHKAEQSSLPSPASATATVPSTDAAVLQMLQQLQEEITTLKAANTRSSMPANPPPSSNGSTPTAKCSNGSCTPSEPVRQLIGFHRNTVATAQDVLPHVATDDLTTVEDRYTVAHKDFRTGEIKRYTLQRVNNFISHYKGILRQAIDQDLGQRVIDNRQAKLQYWQGKQEELLQKIQE